MKYIAIVTVFAEAGSCKTHKTEGKIYDLEPVSDCCYEYVDDEGCMTFINEKFIKYFFKKLEEVMMKAIKITTNNVISVIDIPEQSLWGMQQHVSGPIETVRPFGFTYLNVPNKLSLVMIVNEEGLCIQLPLNLLGTRLYNYPELDDEQPIVGDILIMAEGFVDGEPDIVGLEDDLTIALFQELKSRYSFLKEKKCRACGCTDVCACPCGCYWVEDDLCSECWKEFIDEELEFEEKLEEEFKNEME